MTIPHSDDNHDILLKTIRLSKNIFSLTERLPKAKYRSPKAHSGGELSGVSLLPEKKSKHHHGEDKAQLSIQKPSKNSNKSRLQEYLDQQNNGGPDNNGYEEEEMDPANHEANDNNSNVAVNAHQRAKALKIKTDVAKNTNKRGQNSDYENDDAAIGTRHSKK